MKTAIVTDSTSDIPDELVRALDIHVMNNHVIIDGKSYEDGIDISRQEFYERLPTMKEIPTTATASAGAYSELYSRLFNKGVDFILSIHPPKELSGIMNAASTASQAFGGKVKVIDSRSISMGLGYMVIAAAEAASEKVPVDKIIDLLEKTRQRISVVAMLDTLEYIRRSGRVSWARASLGSLLNIKPFLVVRNGLVESIGSVRTRRKGLDRLLDLLRQQGPLERLSILHTNAEQDARQMLQDSQHEDPESSYIINVTTVIGSHVGPNGLGYAVVRK
jgi:DegV family protein with EDD domain